MTTLALNLPTGYGSTAKISTQPRAGGSWSALISPDSVVGQVYSYTVPSGDIVVQLTGVSEENGEPFNVRNGVPYLYQTWQQIDTTVAVSPTIPLPITGLCNVLVSVLFNGAPVSRAVVHCTLSEKNNTVDGFLLSRAVESGFTDESGNCILTLIQFGQFVTGGIYHLVVADCVEANGKILHDRKVKIPNTPTANAEDLVEA